MKKSRRHAHVVIDFKVPLEPISPGLPTSRRGGVNKTSTTTGLNSPTLDEFGFVST
jgi:hypothetical protein